MKGVRDPWFSFIESGTKTVEGKLCKSWITSLQVSDRIIWFDDTVDTVEDILANRNTTPIKSCATTVTGLKFYASFADMLSCEGLENVLPGISSIADGVMVYRKFYSEADEIKNGVMAIHITKD